MRKTRIEENDNKNNIAIKRLAAFILHIIHSVRHHGNCQLNYTI